VLSRNIDFARWVFAYQHNSQPGRDPMLGFQPRHMVCHLPAHICGKGFSVNDLSAHDPSFFSSEIRTCT
jgi:hypothetical protein